MDDTRYLPLDEEEQEILDFIEKGEWESIPNMEEEMDRLQQSAKAFFANQESLILITRDELFQAREILKGQLNYDYSPTAAQNIQSLLDKIESAIEHRS